MKPEEILKQRFGKDSLIALATVENGIPHVRTVDAVYIDGAFYVVTYSLSGKMQQIEKNPTVAISGEWFTAHGVGENLGHVLLHENKEIMDILRAAFADPATLRRELYDYHFLDRSRDGKVYRLAEKQPTAADLGIRP